MAAILSPMPVWARPAFVRAAPPSAELVALPLRTAAVLPELEHRLGGDRGHPVAVAAVPVVDRLEALHERRQLSAQLVDVGLQRFGCDRHRPSPLLEQGPQ